MMMPDETFTQEQLNALEDPEKLRQGVKLCTVSSAWRFGQAESESPVEAGVQLIEKTGKIGVYLGGRLISQEAWEKLCQLLGLAILQSPIQLTDKN